MKIKTVEYRLDSAAEFDREVNQALANGWILEKRYLSNTIATDKYRILIAELIYPDPDPDQTEIERLEARIDELKNENIALRGENSRLRNEFIDKLLKQEVK